MTKKITYILVIIVFLTYNSYSQEVSNCPVNIIENTNLTKNINVSSSGDCLTVTTSNVIIDCKGFNIKGNGTDSGIQFNVLIGNVTIQNCNIHNFSTGIATFNSYNNSFNNLLISNNSLTGISLYGDTRTNLNNIRLLYNNNGIGICGSNNYLSSITANYNNIGLGIVGLCGSKNNTVVSSNFKTNTNINIQFVDFSGTFPQNNTIQDSYLGNSSKITVTGGSWATCNNTFIGNYYTDMGGFANGDCFDATNMTCDYSRQLEDISLQKANIFPFTNRIPQIIGIILLFGYLFIS